MSWIYLFAAGALEIFWAVGLKYSRGFTELNWSAATIAGMIASFWVLSLAMRDLPLGTAYAVWTGIGAVGTAILGMALFNEPRDTARIVCIVLIVCGIAGLKFTTKG